MTDLSKKAKPTSKSTPFDALPIFKGIDLLAAFKNGTLDSAMVTTKHFEKALSVKELPDYVVNWLLDFGSPRHQAIFLLSRSEEISPAIEFLTSRYPSIVLHCLESYDQAYLLWAKELGFSIEIDDSYDLDDLRSDIDDWVESLWSEVPLLSRALLPLDGKPSSLQFEMLRAFNRIESEYERNGMMNWGDGSGFYEGFVELLEKNLLSDDVFSSIVKKVAHADLYEVRCSGDRGRAASMGEELATSELSDQLLNSETERSLQRLGALTMIWCQKNTDPIAFP